jgi:hypothetical protein
MRTGALDFGGLICTFHDASYVPVSYKLSEKFPEVTPTNSAAMHHSAFRPASPPGLLRCYRSNAAHAEHLTGLSGGTRPLRIGETHDYRRFPEVGDNGRSQA